MERDVTTFGGGREARLTERHYEALRALDGPGPKDVRNEPFTTRHIVRELSELGLVDFDEELDAAWTNVDGRALLLETWAELDDEEEAFEALSLIDGRP